MTPRSWLASYPKSGNTWFRLIVANLDAEDDNSLATGSSGTPDLMASARAPFDDMLLLESGLLTHDECAALRPLFHRAELMQDGNGVFRQEAERPHSTKMGYRLTKTHDAWSYLPDGQPVLGGAQAAGNAILMVRDPRDIAPSLANHMGFSIDQAIDFMNDPDASLSGRRHEQTLQLRQLLMCWSEFNASWLDQTSIPVHCIRYEDMQEAPMAAMSAALAACGRAVDTERLRRAIERTSFDTLHKLEEESGFAEAYRGRRFFRRGVSGAWRDELTRGQVKRIERNHAAMMDRLGYEAAFYSEF
ncbi:sulfotransferase domain-containing protein [Novosphingobium beihaiensis]|uniref:Sulfotransferase domain-containing protein n=1 Tax=Novosphingobium beihaiensis TaxID=2930389 RepID=A0ABT0BW19_9SPHN|nr:sulfotransferase domain-containing protein [Novosphingobium beihaiensis]MCJ2189229.1 sulfotransferase domain-containing protein [Novosphingobium beihaiensis]